MINNSGIKYFIYITSLNNNLYLPLEIEKLFGKNVIYLELFNVGFVIKY